MRPLRTFTVKPSLPSELAPLLEIARNLRWGWHGEARDLFRRLDPAAWEASMHNPVLMLGRINQERLETAARDAGYLAHLERIRADLQNYVRRPGWWPKTHGQEIPGAQMVYFCAEFGISECLPIYSGGLGVLAGDHLKSASALDLPLVGVGLMYQQGYFRQRLNADGWQLELFPRNDFPNMPLELVTDADGKPVTCSVDLCGRKVTIQVWLVRVGRIRLYLLDTNVPDNTPEDRQVTAQLYGGDQEMRIRQEIVLGIGGVQALRALGIQPQVWHMNEGHSAFLGLERIRLLMTESKLTFDEAWEVVAASSVFTTHTPVPAGNDAFDPWLIDKYFADYWPKLGRTREQFLAMGRQDAESKDEQLSLTVLAMRLSAYRNGVSQLHGQVSKKLWAGTWPGVPTNEVPVGAITNGIHTRSWISDDLSTLYDRYLGPDWQERPADVSVWEQVAQIPDTEVWRTHERRRERLVAFARRRVYQQCARRGAGASDLAEAQEMLDPEALTIGFARRFATYKRANLILADLDRLAALLNDPQRPVQILFAGKAHPRDNPGKDLIRQIVHTARMEPFRRSMVFIEDYDINVARYLVQGVDVWLNTPLRPMEASGTSGMKVAANGGLNLSVPDGWWVEGYQPEVGWAIGSGESYDDLEYQNAVESRALYDLLEKEIVPLFYDRGADHLPRGWIAKMKAAMAQLAPVFNTNRMVRQYAERFYLPAMRHYVKLTENDMAKTRELTGWKFRMWERFHNVRVESVQDSMNGGAQVGQAIRVEASVHLGGASPDDLTVELYYGLLDEDGQLNEGAALTMERVKTDGDRAVYAVEMPCAKTGMTGYTVRVLPHHPLMINPQDLALIRWA